MKYCLLLVFNKNTDSVGTLTRFIQHISVHLLWALQSLLQLQAQLVGWQPELGAHPLGSGHPWSQTHVCVPTWESPLRGSEPQTLRPHRGQLWSKLSLLSWCKLGRVGGEFWVHGNWGGSGLLGWKILRQRVEAATLGREDQKDQLSFSNQQRSSTFHRLPTLQPHK